MKKMVLSVLCASVSLNCFASSDEAWQELRTEVKNACEVEIKGNFESYTLKVDPVGSKSYGIAIATGSSKGGQGDVTQVCIFDKRSKRVEIGSTFSDDMNMESSADEDKFYFDVKIMKWKDEQGVCHTCTEANGFPVPVVLDGFYYDPQDKSWHGPESSDICHTCTPQNGFPKNPQ